MGEGVERGTHSDTEEARPSPLRWYRAAAIGVSLVCLIYAAWAHVGTHLWPKASDYVSFWTAGRLALSGHPDLAYNIARHHAAEQAVGHVGGMLPFPYPPPFLAIIAPFALLPFGASFYLWVFATAALYGWAARHFAPLPYAFAMPAAYLNLLIGQNGFLTSGIFISGVTVIETNPWLAGTILGLMVLKPQLALLLPIAMLAGREWRVIAGAIVSTIALLVLGLILFGSRSYQAFFDILPHYVQFLRDNRLPWNELASPFALARFLGLQQSSALMVHSAVAFVAAALTARAWWLRLEERVPILAAATLLMSPYSYTYDALLLIVPIGWMISNGRYQYIPVVWICAFLPLITYYTPFVGVNLTSIAAVICLWVAHLGPRANPPGREPLDSASRDAAEASAAS
jgi:hypothetical protein